ncbi:polysaccharide deacetylase family protein [Parabacteroides distasonis]|nr:polysaccharide deacetylase family protein [Parabacteroides distasonis]
MMPPGFYINLLKDKYVRWRFNRHSAESGQGSVILMFHHVAEKCPEGVSESCYSSITDFLNLLNKLSKSKQFISLSELCKYLQIGVVPKDKVVITFDDVPVDVYHNAVPVLKELRVPYTLFISTRLIGTKGFLSSKQIVELANDPLCTIGSHTISHCMLKKKGLNIQKELQGSKEVLEQLIHKPVEHFAYPYGTPFAISKKVIKQVKESGLYRSAVCTIPAYINDHSLEHRFSLPRIHSQLFCNEYLKNNKQ